MDNRRKLSNSAYTVSLSVYSGTCGILRGRCKNYGCRTEELVTQKFWELYTNLQYNSKLKKISVMISD